jgi:O-acetylserine/cysteine efflux transporter
MPLTHQLLALLVVAIWGTNFVVIAHALQSLPPLWLAVFRYGLAFFPLALFIKPPAAKLAPLAAYGVLLGVGQFALLFIAMNGFISPGLASLVIQMQVFFTIGLVVVLEGERPSRWQWLAFAVALGGLALIAASSDASATPWGLMMVLMAAFFWGLANVVGRRVGRVNALALVVWSSAFAVPPLLVLALIFEGPGAIAHGVSQATASTWVAVVWQAVGNALVGYAAWTWLLARHPAAAVTPWALAVPVFGMTASALWLGESLTAWKLAAAACVMLGLLINVLSTTRWGKTSTNAKATS